MKQSQTDKLYNLFSDGKPHRTDEIQQIVYGSEHLGLARCGARVWDLKKKYHVQINGWHDPENASLYWYEMVQEKQSLFARIKTYIEAWLRTEPNKIFSRDELEATAIKHGYDRAEIISAMQAIDKIFSPIIW